MSADKTQSIEITGKVVSKTFGSDSKSEHAGVFLISPEGEYKLRRKGGNPFRDTFLDGLVGKTISARGSVHDYLLIMEDYTIL